jgi:DNA-binding transcriptional LysR family regulator
MLVDDPQATARCILAGLGIGFVPGRVTAQWADRKLAAIAVNGVRLDWPLNAHRLTSFPASAALEAFWTVLGADTR